ncbi:hypothetical protein LJC63_01090 [Ruminococcaceae bacterium OttesenSCG-928-L11]|nr:hypothetical protein [Ruminococcaceae bacterium OttesenSCG-928-L11]
MKKRSGMRNISALLIAVCLFLPGVTAYAETNVSITTSDHEAIADAVNIADTTVQNIAGATAQDVTAEIEIPLVTKAFELSADAGTDALTEPFEQNGYLYTVKDMESRTYEESPPQSVSKIAIYMSDTDDEVEIRAQFPTTIEYAEDGYFGELALDAASITTEPDEYETYAYQYTKTREYPGLIRNDPAYIDREWNGMSLADVVFKQQGDGRYTGFATYNGTASGKRPVSYITTATYSGETISDAPTSVLYTVTYEGTPVDPPVVADVAIEEIVPVVEAEPEPETEPEVELTEEISTHDATSQSGDFSVLHLVFVGIIGLLGGALCSKIILAFRGRKKKA